MATRKRPDGKTEILDPDTCSGYYTQFRALKGIHTRFVDNGDDICNRCKLGPMWSSDNPDNAYDDASLQGDPLKKGMPRWMHQNKLSSRVNALKILTTKQAI